MQVFLDTLEIHETEENVLKVKAELRNGSIEVYPNHQNLIGKICNQIIEITGKSKLTYYLVQDGIFLVITERVLEPVTQRSESESTIYIYAKRALKLNDDLKFSEVLGMYDLKSIQLSLLKEAQGPVPTKVLLLIEELAFLQQVLKILKKLENF